MFFWKIGVIFLLLFIIGMFFIFFQKHPVLRNLRRPPMRLSHLPPIPPRKLPLRHHRQIHQLNQLQKLPTQKYGGRQSSQVPLIKFRQMYPN